MGKCTFCYHRTSKGMQPKCVSTCITNSRLFGDLNDPESDISRRLAEVDAERLHAELDGEVAVYYLGLSANPGGARGVRRLPRRRARRQLIPLPPFCAGMRRLGAPSPRTTSKECAHDLAHH